MHGRMGNGFRQTSLQQFAVVTFLNVEGTSVVYDDHEKVVIGARALAVAAELLIEFLEVVAKGSHSRTVAGPEDDTAAMVGECLPNEILSKPACIQKLPTGYGQDRLAELFGQRLNGFAVAPQGRAVNGGNAQWRQRIRKARARSRPAALSGLSGVESAFSAWRTRINVVVVPGGDRILFGVPPPAQVMMNGMINVRNIIRLV